MSFKWQYKNDNKSKEDCSINLFKSAGREYSSIIIRNNFANKIAPNGYMVCAINGDKMYFKAENDVVGYKLSNKGSKSYNIQLRNKTINQFVKYHAGDYKILFDIKNNLYFIDTEKNL